MPSLAARRALRPADPPPAASPGHALDDEDDATFTPTPQQWRMEMVKRAIGVALLTPVLAAMVYKGYEAGDLGPLALVALACVGAFVIVWRLSGLWPWM